MNLLIPQYNICLAFRENAINVLTVENANAFSNILCDIWNQCNGLPGEIILSEKDKELKLATNVDIVFNIFDIDLNDKKIIAKIYQELVQNSNELLLEQMSVVNSSIVNFIDEVMMTVPYRLKQNIDVDLIGLFKLYDVKIDTEDGDLLERIADYIKLVHQVLRKKIFIFINLKQYLTKNELIHLYEICSYEKVFVLIIEGNDLGHIDNEIHQILDRDLCIIEY